jgi:hypothetical protein
MIRRELWIQVFFLGLNSIKVKILDSGLDPMFFFTKIQHPRCIYEHIGSTAVTTYYWLLEEKNRYIIISCCSFLTINASKIKNVRLVEKRKTEGLYVDFNSIVLRFQAKCKLGLVKTKDGLKLKKNIFEHGPEKKIFRPESHNKNLSLCFNRSNMKNIFTRNSFLRKLHLLIYFLRMS